MAREGHEASDAWQSLRDELFAQQLRGAYPDLARKFAHMHGFELPEMKTQPDPQLPTDISQGASEPDVGAEAESIPDAPDTPYFDQLQQMLSNDDDPGAQALAREVRRRIDELSPAMPDIPDGPGADAFRRAWQAQQSATVEPILAQILGDIPR